MNRLTLGDVNYTLPVSGQFSLPPGAHPVDTWAEQILQRLHGSSLRTAWLPGEGGLISNLSLIENCLLPLQWHEALPVRELEPRLAAALDCLGLAGDAASFLQSRPNQANARQRQQTLFLRVLLLQPAVVLFGSGALRGEFSGELLTQVWPRWLPHSLLLYAGSAGLWPALSPQPETSLETPA